MSHRAGFWIRTLAAVLDLFAMTPVYFIATMVMLAVWDRVGCFAEPGGPGGSEDVDWSKRATAAGYGLAVTDPMCIIHTGLTGSSGTPLIGQHLVVERNREIEKHYHIEGVIQYA